MTATNHVVTGAAIGALVVNPWFALPLALGSHFLLDALPHMDYPAKASSQKFLIWLAVDLGLAGSILVSLWLIHPVNAAVIVACGALAALPDGMWLYYTMYKKYPKGQYPHWLPKFHSVIQKRTSPKYWPIELLWFCLVASILIGQLQPAG